MIQPKIGLENPDSVKPGSVFVKQPSLRYLDKGSWLISEVSLSNLVKYIGYGPALP